MIWPFRRAAGETRAVTYTDRQTADDYAAVAGKAADSSALAAVEACRGVWERAMAAAVIGPSGAALEALTPDLLGMAGRALAARGEFVCLIKVADGVTLHPASSFDVRGSHDRWTYRIDLIGPNDTETLDGVDADQVLHFRINTTPQRPWRGRSPLALSEATATLAAELERSHGNEARMPSKRLLPIAGTPDQASEIGKGVGDGNSRIVTTTIGQGSGYADQLPANRWDAVRIGPVFDPGGVQLRGDLRTDIYAAHGIPPGLFDQDSDAVGQRELWRRFCYATMGPLGRVIEAELRAKLEPMAAVAFDGLRAADIEGRARALRSRVQSAVALAATEGMTIDRALAICGVPTDSDNGES